jgi:hypothetical protein
MSRICGFERVKFGHEDMGRKPLSFFPQMCRKITCEKCNKPTWAGCGMHIETALAGIAVADRCQCKKQ